MIGFRRLVEKLHRAGERIVERRIAFLDAPASARSSERAASGLKRYRRAILSRCRECPREGDSAHETRDMPAPIEDAGDDGGGDEDGQQPADAADGGDEIETVPQRGERLA